MSLCGSAALIKVCLAFEHGTLPGNLHYSAPNPNNASLVSGILQVSVSSHLNPCCPGTAARAGSLHHAIYMMGLPVTCN